MQLQDKFYQLTWSQLVTIASLLYKYIYPFDFSVEWVYQWVAYYWFL